MLVAHDRHKIESSLHLCYFNKFYCCCNGSLTRYQYTCKSGVCQDQSYLEYIFGNLYYIGWER